MSSALVSASTAASRTPLESNLSHGDIFARGGLLRSPPSPPPFPCSRGSPDWLRNVVGASLSVVPSPSRGAAPPGETSRGDVSPPPAGEWKNGGRGRPSFVVRRSKKKRETGAAEILLSFLHFFNSLGEAFFASPPNGGAGGRGAADDVPRPKGEPRRQGRGGGYSAPSSGGRSKAPASFKL